MKALSTEHWLHWHRLSDTGEQLISLLHSHVLLGTSSKSHYNHLELSSERPLRPATKPQGTQRTDNGMIRLFRYHRTDKWEQAWDGQVTVAASVVGQKDKRGLRVLEMHLTSASRMLELSTKPLNSCSHILILSLGRTAPIICLTWNHALNSFGQGMQVLLETTVCLCD